VNFAWGALGEAAWRSAVMLVPIVAAIALLCRCCHLRATTRHALWLGAMAWLCIGPWLPAPPSGSRHIAKLFKHEVDVDNSGAERMTAPQFVSLQISGEEASGIDRSEVTETSVELESFSREHFNKLQTTNWLTKVGGIARNRFLAGLRQLKYAAQSHGDVDTPVIDTPLLALRAGDVGRSDLDIPANDVSDAPTIASAAFPLNDAAYANDEASTGWTLGFQRVVADLGQWTKGAWRSAQAIVMWPALPVEWWLAGIFLAAAWQVVRLVRFRARLGGAATADAATRRLVQLAANELGLAHAPRIGMIAARVSPMVWCLGRPCLLLPTELWSQLDDVGRRAVVLHELAHLRRRDHWVRRMETLVGAAYWWHPLVWCIRSRLNEEADLCCDQWVTSLLPSGRATYARALLETKRFVGVGAGEMPAVAIGAVSGRFTRFSRRLTMIMTDTHTPRRSMSGLVLVMGLMISGWLATPALSGDTPPTPPAQPTAPVAAEPALVVAVPSAEIAAATEALGAVVVAAGDDKDLEDRMERLEEQMSELMEKLDRIGGHGATPPAAPLGMLRTPRVARVPSPRRVPAAPRAISQAGTIGRSYELPQGKLEALTELLVRDDVPILVRPKDGALEIIATPEQHEHIEAFIQMINPGDGEHQPHAGGTGSSHASLTDEQRASMDAMRSRMQTLRQAFRSKQNKMKRKEILGSMHQAAEALGHRAEALERAADNLEKKSEELREKAKSLREKHGKDGEGQTSAADELDEQAEAVDAQADTVRSEMEAVQEYADRAQDEADEMADQLASGDEEKDEEAAG
jgi:beta-lactamase regulating signal transducer with metallopeptidase domain/chaperonin cofactor prefoldin